MTKTTARIAHLEAEAGRYAKLAQFEFSPITARFYAERAQTLMAEAQSLRTADLEQRAEESWLLRVGRDADRWYNDRAAARMAGEYM